MNSRFSSCIFSALSRTLSGVLAAICLAFLPPSGWSHGEVAGGGQQSATRIVEAPGGKYRIVVMHSPALPTAGEPANIEITITRLLPQPDPLLGSEVPVSLLPEASLVYASSQKVADPHLPVHPEGETGVSGVAEYKFPASGSFLLRFLIHSETGDQFSVDFPVTVQVNVASFFRLWVNLAVAVLILGLTGMQLWKIRTRGGDLAEMLRPVSLGVISLLAVILLMNFFILDQVLAMRKPKVAETPADLVTVNEDGSYTIPEAIQKELGVVLVSVKKMPLGESISAYGRTEPSPPLEAEVFAPLWGRIEFADRPLAVGDFVEKGQQLVRVTLELSAIERAPMEAKQKDIRAALQQAKDRLETAQIEYDRAEKLFQANPAFEQDLEWAKNWLAEAKDAYRQIEEQDKAYVGVIQFRDPRKTLVTAPIAGTITSVDFISGALNLNGEYRKLFTIVDTSHVWVRGTVVLPDALRLQVGQPALVFPSSRPDQPMRGTIRYLDDTVDLVDRTLTVLVDVPNPAGTLVLGAFARVEFPHPQRGLSVGVPEQAVVDDGATKWVYLAREKERFEPTPIAVGVKKGGWWQVLSGLQEGDLVIAKGAGLFGSLRSEEAPAVVSSPPPPESHLHQTSELTGAHLSGQ